MFADIRCLFLYLYYYTHSIKVNKKDNKSYHITENRAIVLSKDGDEIDTKEVRKKLKVSTYEFSSMLGISRPTLYFKENGQRDWTLPEIVAIIQFMEKNKMGEHLTVSCDGHIYEIRIKKIQ